MFAILVSVTCQTEAYNYSVEIFSQLKSNVHGDFTAVSLVTALAYF